MSDVIKKPQAGEWWRDCEDEILYVVGKTPTGETICVDIENTTFVFNNMPSWEHWQHLPDCTGWGWQPEVWPKYYEAWEPNNAFVRVERNGNVFVVTKSRVVIESCRPMFDFADRKQLTKEQAEALLDKPATYLSECPDCGEFRGHGHECNPATKALHELALRAGFDPLGLNPADIADKLICEYKSLEGTKVGTVKITPVESPDDWVTQDRVPARPIDERRYVGRGRKYDDWLSCSMVNWIREVRHGDNINGDTVELRCRRKDLPVLPSAKRVPVDIIATALGNVLWRNHGADLHASDRFIFSDGNGGWYIEVPE